MLKDSFKRKTVDGLYRTIHPIETYKKAREALNKYFQKYDVQFVTDENDFGLSALYPRAIYLFNKDDNVNEAVTWGKGVTPIASLTSALMENIESVAGEIFFNKNVEIPNDELNDFLDNSSNKSYQELTKYLFEKNYDSKFININRLDISEENFKNVEISYAALLLLMTGYYKMNENFLDLDIAIRGCSSWGSGAGNTFEEALMHSIMEILERIARGTIIYQKREVQEIDVSTIDNELILNLIDDLNNSGIKSFKFSDWSMGLNIPIVCMSWKDDRNYFKIGTGTTKEEAMQRAITEFIQTLGPQKRANSGEYIHLISELESSDDFSIVGKINYKDIEDVDNENIKVEIEKVVSILNSIGLYVYFLDLSSEELGIPVTHTFILDKKIDKITLNSGILIKDN